MISLLAHAETASQTAPSWLTDPSVMNLLFLVGILIIGWALRRLFSDINPWQRIALVASYCLLATVLSFHYNKLLSVTAFSLATLCLLTAKFYFLLVLPEPKKSTARSTK